MLFATLFRRIKNKKCLKVRQKLGTRENLKNWKFENFWNFEILNSLSWSFGHAEQLLFSCLGSKFTVYSRKLQRFFDSHSSHTLSCEFANHRAGSQLKTYIILPNTNLNPLEITDLKYIVKSQICGEKLNCFKFQISDLKKINFRVIKGAFEDVLWVSWWLFGGKGTLRSFWAWFEAHFRVIWWDQFRAIFGVISGSFRCHLGIILAYFGGHLMTIWVVILGLFWGPIKDRFGITLGLFEDHLVGLLSYLMVIWGNFSNK